MFYRDYMQKFRPLYAAPDAASGATDGAAAVTEPAAMSPGETVAAKPAGEGDAPAAPAAPATSDAAPAADAAAVAAETKTDDASLIEAADGKNPDSKSEADAKPADDKKDDPAPAEAKPDGDKKPEDKKAEGDKKPDAEAKADPDNKDATAEAQPPAPLSYEAFKLPEGIALDDKELAKFTEIAGKAQIPQDVAQSMIDLYVAERKNDVEQAAANQRRVWNTLNDTWKADTRKELGNHYETDLSIAKAVVEEFGGTQEQQKEYWAHVKNNGMGNYIGHIRLLRNIGKAMNVFEDSIVNANPSVPKAQKGPGQRGWYDNSKMGGAPPA